MHVGRFHHLDRGGRLVEALGLGLVPGGEHPGVVARQHLGEPRAGSRPVAQQIGGHIGAGLLVVPGDQLPQQFEIGITGL